MSKQDLLSLEQVTSRYIRKYILSMLRTWFLRLNLFWPRIVASIYLTVYATRLIINCIYIDTRYKYTINKSTLKFKNQWHVDNIFEGATASSRYILQTLVKIEKK